MEMFIFGFICLLVGCVIGYLLGDHYAWKKFRNAVPVLLNWKENTASDADVIEAQRRLKERGLV